MVVLKLCQRVATSVNAYQTPQPVQVLLLAVILTNVLMGLTFLNQEQPAQPSTGVLLQVLIVVQVEVAQQRVLSMVVAPHRLFAVLTRSYVLMEVVKQVQLLVLQFLPVRQPNNSVPILSVHKLAPPTKEQYVLQPQPL